MSDNNYSNKSVDELSVKEALSIDVGKIALSSVMIDPALMPVTPTVIWKKAIKGAKVIVNTIKSKSRDNK